MFSPRSGETQKVVTPLTPDYQGGDTIYDTCDSLFDSVFFDEQVTEYQSEVGPSSGAARSANSRPSPAQFTSARSHLSPIESVSDGFETAPSETFVHPPETSAASLDTPTSHEGVPITCDDLYLGDGESQSRFDSSSTPLMENLSLLPQTPTDQGKSRGFR